MCQFLCCLLHFYKEPHVTARYILPVDYFVKLACPYSVDFSRKVDRRKTIVKSRTPLFL